VSSGATARFTHVVQVRYGECDQQGVVFNANYLAYVDDAMDTWMRSVLPEQWVSGWDVMLKSVRLVWHSPARWAEDLAIDCAVSRWGRTSFDVSYRLRVAERAVADAVVTYVSVAAGSAAPAPPPPEVRAALGEAIEPPEPLAGP
jgi:acyl-CoA thioester hydrolase